MDDAMMRQLLKTYGMDGSGPVSARNANAIREFGASNPNVLEHRAMGMRGSVLDDNSDLLSTYLDKVAAETAAPAGKVEVGQPQLAPQQAPAAPRARAPTPGPQFGPNLPMRDPKLNDEISGNPQAPGGGGDSWWKLLMAALGTTAVGAGSRQLVPGQERRMTGYEPQVDTTSRGPAPPSRMTGGPVTDVNDLNAKQLPSQKESSMPDSQTRINEQRKLPGGQYQNVEDVGKEMEGVTARNATSRAANDAMVQRSVDADNALLQDQLMKQAKQRQTEELLRRAGRYYGRR